MFSILNNGMGIVITETEVRFVVPLDMVNQAVNILGLLQTDGKNQPVMVDQIDMESCSVSIERKVK
jgi:hypothetical protein